MVIMSDWIPRLAYCPSRRWDAGADKCAGWTGMGFLGRGRRPSEPFTVFGPATSSARSSQRAGILESIRDMPPSGRREVSASGMLTAYYGGIVGYYNAETDTVITSPIQPTSEDVGFLGG